MSLTGRVRVSGDAAARGRRESGFTLVEVVVAVMIIALVSGAAVAIVASSSRSSGRLKVSDRQHAIASSVLNRALSNRAWVTTYSCGVGPCTAAKNAYASDPLLKEPGDSVVHSVSFDATGVDLPNDGVAPNDADRQVPDVYRIAVTVTSTAPDEVGTFKPYTVSGTLNMSVRSQTGTLRLRACTTNASVDERIGLGLCSKPGTQTFPIAPPVSGCGVNTAECIAWNAAAGIAASRTLIVQPSAMTFALTGPIGQEDNPPTRTVKTASDGFAEVLGLKPGRYELTQGSSRWKLWASHSMPSGGSITITAGEVNEAAQVFYPAPTPTRISLEYLDLTDPTVDDAVMPGARVTRAIKLVPVPTGRAALANGTADRGWTKINKGDRSVLIVDLSPGLYSIQMLEAPGTKMLVKEVKGRSATGGYVSPGFIWIPPFDQADTQVPRELVLQDQYCNSAKRRQLMEQRISALQLSFGMLETGFFWYHTIPGKPNGRYHSHCTGENPDLSTDEVTGEAGA